jgi:hypothetical protein
MKDRTALYSWQWHILENRPDYDITSEEGPWTFTFLPTGRSRPPYLSYTFVITMLQNHEWQKKIQDEINVTIGVD